VAVYSSRIFWRSWAGAFNMHYSMQSDKPAVQI
jgi:hypothetical protein